MTNLFPSILVPLDGSTIAAQSLGCATWLVSKLKAHLHILSAAQERLSARQELIRLKVPEPYWQSVTLHQAAAYPATEIIATATRHRMGLIIMSSQGQAAEGRVDSRRERSAALGSVARTVIERSAQPVLLLPPRYCEALPWERILVPLSGETEADQALVVALRLANELDLDVHVAHVAGTEESGESLAGRARYADAIHHEYPGRFAEFVRSALPQYGPRECRRIVDVALCHGSVASEILNLTEQKRINLIVVCWRGSFADGHARVLTEILQQAAIPTVLVKPERRAGLRLNVGEEI